MCHGKESTPGSLLPSGSERADCAWGIMSKRKTALNNCLPTENRVKSEIYQTRPLAREHRAFPSISSPEGKAGEMSSRDPTSAEGTQVLRGRGRANRLQKTDRSLSLYLPTPKKKKRQKKKTLPNNHPNQDPTNRSFWWSVYGELWGTEKKMEE